MAGGMAPQGIISPALMSPRDTIAKSARTRLAAIPAPVAGALLMTGAAFGFSVMNVAIRAVADGGIPPVEIAFFRNLFALVFMLPWLIRRGRAALVTQRLPLHLGRALLGLAAMLTWFYSVALLPLAEAVALNFTVPLFATIGAALILRETVRRRRWTATAIGFVGVLVILRPGFAEVSAVTLLPVLAALLMAASILVVKTLARTERPAAIVFYMNLLLTPLSLIPALFDWHWPNLTQFALLALVGGVAALAHIALTRAYQIADASAVVPFDYARLPFVALIAFILFGEVPDIWTWVGAAIIAGAAIYIARREARLARERADVRPPSGLAARAPEGQS
ncbi:MAG: DMT family transporter [Rhodovibrionaceae bacterium]|nr:DMT family transporter [Rhodovibrionaceae bacterium]